MKIKDELQAIYEDEENVYYCCYCLEPQGEKILELVSMVLRFMKTTS